MTNSELIQTGRALREAQIAADTAERKVIRAFANMIGYSQQYPFEVVKTVSATTVDVRNMQEIRDPNWKPEIIAGGFAGHCVNQQSQTWLYESRPEAPVVRIRWSNAKRGWYDKHGSRYSMADAPRYFYDYNF